mgnify:FL=1|tara:strand:+ start:91 stop:414 length:324 start_codon:yes stop_codon:yes gene_type:complete
MPNNFKLKTAQTTASLVTMYTATSVTTTVIGMTMANISASSVNASVKIIKDGGTDIYIVKDAPIAVGSSLVVVGGNQKVVLEANDAIQIVSSVTATVEVSLSILEMS